ncbi:hypothetical protein [Kitasatospora purpeofusca]|uniref:hypothetical protein n=1 Tax=Kitasatospora purpeofusca TaxID=67352 RepID=UPI00382C6C65
MIITASTLDASATRLAELLGNYTPAPLLTDDRATLRLANPDGYTIGARARVDGTTLQLWVTAPGTKAKMRPGLQPLQPGRSYHTVLQLAGLDGDLGDTIHAAIANRLLPAIALKPQYVGHRPWEQEPAPTDTDAATAAPTDPSETSEPAGAEPAEPTTDTPAADGEDSSDPDTGAATAQIGRAPEAARPARKRITTKNPTPAPDTKPSKARTTTTATSGKPTRATAKKTTTPQAPATAAKPTRTRSATKKTTSPTKTPRTRKATETPRRRTPAAETP